MHGVRDVLVPGADNSEKPKSVAVVVAAFAATAFVPAANGETVLGAGRSEKPRSVAAAAFTVETAAPP